MADVFAANQNNNYVIRSFIQLHNISNRNNIEVISDELSPSKLAKAASFDIVNGALYVIIVNIHSNHFCKSYNFRRKEWKDLLLEYRKFETVPDLENPGFDVYFKLLYRNEKKKGRKAMIYHDRSDVEDSE